MDAVLPFPGNARRGNQEKIKTSLRKHGQYKELIVQDSTGYIVVGNNTYAAMRDLGYTEVAVLRLDLDDAKARELLLMDNSSSDDGIYDERALVALLGDVVDWDAVGWDPDDLDDLLVKLEENTGDPDALAAALPPQVVADRPRVLDAVPATDARYAETPEAEAARQEKFDGWAPRYSKGLTEVILVYPEDRRAELLDLIARVKKARGTDGAKNGDVILGAMRLLAEVHAAHTRGDFAVDVETALTVATPPVPADDTPEEPAAAGADTDVEPDPVGDDAHDDRPAAPLPPEGIGVEQG